MAALSSSCSISHRSLKMFDYLPPLPYTIVRRSSGEGHSNRLQVVCKRPESCVEARGWRKGMGNCWIWR